MTLPPKRRPLRLFLVIVALVLFSERDAHAYTDPGTGALMVQAFLAGLVGLMFYFRRFTSWFKERKGSKGKKKEAEE